VGGTESVSYQSAGRFKPDYKHGIPAMAFECGYQGNMDEDYSFGQALDSGPQNGHVLGETEDYYFIPETELLDMSGL